MRQQRGFTLLELMVAMAIFALMAVAGWQVFDGVNRAREQAQYHADHLAVLQHAYLQLQQDMAQIIPYQAPVAQSSNKAANAPNPSNNPNNNDNNEPMIAAEPFMTLDGEQVSFVRFADPDPRYQSSPSLQRIDYIFDDQRLIRRQYTSIQGDSDSISLDSVLLEGVSAGLWQAYLPELSSKFPNPNSQSNMSANNQAQTENTADEVPEVLLLPKGIGLRFTYQDIPITWQWALTPQVIANNSDSKEPEQ